MVKELRERTGAGPIDCKKALTETAGDMEKAAEYLRKKGLAKAASKSSRVATEGAVASYIHAGGKIGVLVEVNCETDFVAKTDDFKNFVKDVAMQIAATNPPFVRREDVPADAVEKQKQVFADQAKSEGKPEKIIGNIVEGRVKKWFTEVCLLEMPFVKDPDKSIEQVRNETIAKIGENISVRRFVRYELGEGMEKKKDDFAAEVAAQAGLGKN
jgi:elongation factor Ts